MKLLRTLVAPLLAVTFMVGCSDSIGSDPIGPESTPEEIAAALNGTWNATSFVFTNVANTSETFDLIANGGSFSLTITADGQFTGTLTSPGENETFSGTYVAQGTNLILTDAMEPNDPETVSFTLSGNTLTIDSDDVFDFDDDGVDEPATSRLVLQRS